MHFNIVHIFPKVSGDAGKFHGRIYAFRKRANPIILMRSCFRLVLFFYSLVRFFQIILSASLGQGWSLFSKGWGLGGFSLSGRRRRYGN